MVLNAQAVHQKIQQERLQEQEMSGYRCLDVVILPLATAGAGIRRAQDLFTGQVDKSIGPGECFLRPAKYRRVSLAIFQMEVDASPDSIRMSFGDHRRLSEVEVVDFCRYHRDLLANETLFHSWQGIIVVTMRGDDLDVRRESFTAYIQWSAQKERRVVARSC